MSWFENHGISRLWYDECGSGTPIVLIHGWCMSSAVWALQREGLADSYRVITLDLRGHGATPPHPDGFGIRGCAMDIVGLINNLGVGDVIVAGWSLGALIAIETLLLCTERVSGLVLISGTPQFVQSVDFPYGVVRSEADGMAKKVCRSVQRARDGFLTRMLVPGEDGSGFVHSLLSSVPVPATDVALQALDALVTADMRDSLSMISCPTLILNGDSDVICLPQASEFMSQQILTSRQVIFSECGHVPFLSQSSKFNECLEGFRVTVNGAPYRQA